MISKKFERSRTSRYDENELHLASAILEKIERPLRLLYTLLDSSSEETFTIMMLSEPDTELAGIIRKHKRTTDLLFEIGSGENLSLVICQDTSIDGSYYFMNRLSKEIINAGGKRLTSVMVQVVHCGYTAEQIALKLLDVYTQAKADNISLAGTYHILD